MGFFKKVLSKAGEFLDNAFEKIAEYTIKLAKKILDNARRVAMCIGKFFTLLTSWLDKAMKYVRATFNVIVNGVQTFIKKVGNEYQEISYNYSKQTDGSYIKNTVVKQTFVSEDEIPADIREKASKLKNEEMIDISAKTAEKQELGLAA